MLTFQEKNTLRDLLFSGKLGPICKGTALYIASMTDEQARKALADAKQKELDALIAAKNKIEAQINSLNK